MLGHYPFWSYATVATLTRAGDEAAGPAVLLTIATLGGSPARGALLMAALTASAALGGPILGAALDRMRRPKLGYLAGLATMAGGLAVLAAGIDHLSLAVLLAAGLSAGIAQPMFSGGWTGQLTRIVGTAEFTRAAALDAATYDVGGIAGPALAAAALAIGPRAPIVACVGMLLAAAPVLCAMQVWAGGTDRPTLRQEVAAGARTLLRRPALRRMTLLSTLQHGGMAGRTIAAPLLARHLTGGVALAGVLLSVSAAASLVSSIVLTRRTLPLAPETTALLATAVTATTVALLAIPSPLWIVVVLFGLGGAVDAPLLTSVFAVRNSETPAALRTQVFATAASLKTSAYAGTTALFGLVAAAGATPCLLLSGGVQLLGIAGAVRRNREPVPVTVD
jgi:hypothetical protein